MVKYIRFEYYRIVYRKISDADSTPDRLFDILPWVEKIKGMELKDRALEVQGEKSRMDNSKVDLESSYHFLHFLRLREASNIQKAKLDGVLKPVDIDDDEYLGEEIAVLIDAPNSIFMTQRNKYSLGPAGLEKYLNQIWGSEDETIYLRPILVRDPIKVAKKSGVYKKFDVKIAEANADKLLAKDTKLAGFIRAFKEYEAPYIRISMSTGHFRSEELGTETVNQVIDEVQSFPELFSDVKVGIINDTSKVEILDLLNNKMTNFYRVRSEKGLTLNHEKLWDVMFSIYHDGHVPEGLTEITGQKRKVLSYC